MGDNPPEQLGFDRLLDSSAAARALGVSRWVTSAIKSASRGCKDSPFTGRYTTLRRLHAWLTRYPDFVASHIHRKRHGRWPSSGPKPRSDDNQRNLGQ
jgi:hypothetical protein